MQCLVSPVWNGVLRLFVRLFWVNTRYPFFSTFCQDLDVSLIEYDCLNKWGNRYDRLDITFSEPFQPFDLSVLNMQPTAVGKSWLHNTEIFSRDVLLY